MLSRNQGGELAYPHGVLQMIGFKEFHDYLQLSPEERATELGQKHFQKGKNSVFFCSFVIFLCVT